MTGIAKLIFISIVIYLSSMLKRAITENGIEQVWFSSISKHSSGAIVFNEGIMISEDLFLAKNNMFYKRHFQLSQIRFLTKRINVLWDNDNFLDAHICLLSKLK